MRNKYKLGPLKISTPEDWCDITDAAGEECPFTLAKNDGVGALQFSVAQYQSGKRPAVRLFDLEEMRDAFARGRHFSNPFDEATAENGALVSCGSYRADRDFVRIWYWSNGVDVVLMTYIADWGKQGDEPRECDEIISGLSF